MKALLAAALLLAGCAAEPGTGNDQAVQAPSVAPSGLDLAPLTIESGGRRHVFIVEVARTEPQQAQGLMNRRSLAPDAGMLFPFDPPRPASFWMRNTLIPLDLIFIRTDGTIARIVTGVPLSEEPMEVDEPLTAVLEIAGGRAAQLGIRTGDRVGWSD